MKTRSLNYLLSILVITFYCGSCEGNKGADDEKEAEERKKKQEQEEKKLEEEKKREYKEEKKKFILKEAEWERKNVEERKQKEKEKKAESDAFEANINDRHQNSDEVFRRLKEELSTLDIGIRKLGVDVHNHSTATYDLHENMLKGYIKRRDNEISNLEYLFQNKYSAEELRLKKELEDMHKAAKAEAEKELEEVRKERASKGL